MVEVEMYFKNIELYLCSVLKQVTSLSLFFKLLFPASIQIYKIFIYSPLSFGVRDLAYDLFIATENLPIYLKVISLQV